MSSQWANGRRKILDLTLYENVGGTFSIHAQRADDQTEYIGTPPEQWRYSPGAAIHYATDSLRLQELLGEQTHTKGGQHGQASTA